tara:strand:- start:20 stop:475 length:456 start_codon:yes stop_codon:yes gene_type:complete
MDKALFGAGCFWGVEECFRKINGVISTQVGYSGGDTQNPTYHDVCGSKTGHAEVLKIEFDSYIISYKKLLDYFWECHDPTTLNMQGPDIGSQYRSVIFYFSEEQKKIAEESKIRNQMKFKNKIVTEIRKIDTFYLAEDYHQRFLQKRENTV